MKNHFISGFIISMFLAVSASAGIPHLINYQALLTDNNGDRIVGTHHLTFSVYPDTLLASSALWSEEHLAVPFVDGVFSVIMGSNNSMPASLFDGEERYLGIQVDSGAEMLPRMKFTAVPWALRASFADTAQTVIGMETHNHDDLYYTESELNSNDGTANESADPVDWTKLKSVPTGFADGTDDVGGTRFALDAFDGDPVNAVFVDIEGNVGIGSTSPAYPLDVVGTAQMTGLKMSTGASDGYVLTSDADGVGTWQVNGSGTGDITAVGAGNGITGGGTSGGVTLDVGAGTGIEVSADAVGLSNPYSSGSAYDGRFVNDSDLDHLNAGDGDPINIVHIFDDGLVSLWNPNSAQLWINSPHEPIISFSGNYSGETWRMSIKDGSGNFTISQGSSTQRLSIDQTGNVGIGTSDPASLLDIAGTAEMTGFKLPTGASNGYVLTSDASGIGTWQAGGSGSGDITAVNAGNGLVGGGTSGEVSLNILVGTGIAASADMLSLTSDYSSGSAYDSRFVNDSDLDHLDSADGSVAGAVFVDNDGKVGIGTTSPDCLLHVMKAGDTEICVEHPGPTYDKNVGFRIKANTVSGSPYANWFLQSDWSGNFALRDETAGTRPFFVEAAAPNYSLCIKQSGSIGLGTNTPSYKLDVTGDIQCVALHETSDERLKTNIKPLENALEAVMNLQGISFEWNEAAESKGAQAGKEQIGLIAQEVERVLPELVATAEDGYKSVDYSKLTAVLIEAVKDLKSENEILMKKIKALEKAME